jgi:fructose-1,6-bisphosphatase II
MAKRSVLAAVALALILGLASVSIGAADFKIGVVTGTVSQGEDEYRGAEAAIQKYPGLILHRSYPDNFMQEQETTIAQITGLASDRQVKAIVINQAVPGTGVDLLMGIGGAPEAVITAAAMKCLGGEIQTKLWVRNEEDAARARENGFNDFDRVYSSEDLARGDSLIFAATGITDGDMLQGVRFYGPKATTESIVMRMLTGTVRRIHTTHDLSRKTLRSFQAGQEMAL